MKEKILKHKNLLPIIFLCLCSIWTIFQVVFTKYEFRGNLYDNNFSITNYIAFVALIIDLIIYFNYRKYFRNTVILTIVAGMFGILNFHLATYRVTFFIITFQLSSFIVILSYIILNYSDVKHKLFGDPISEEARKPDLVKVENFRLKFINKPSDELDELISDKRFIKEAKIAASDILNEREISYSPTANIS